MHQDQWRHLHLSATQAHCRSTWTTVTVPFRASSFSFGPFAAFHLALGTSTSPSLSLSPPQHSLMTQVSRVQPRPYLPRLQLSSPLHSPYRSKVHFHSSSPLLRLLQRVQSHLHSSLCPPQISFPPCYHPDKLPLPLCQEAHHFQTECLPLHFCLSLVQIHHVASNETTQPADTTHCNISNKATTDMTRGVARRVRKE